MPQPTNLKENRTARKAAASQPKRQAVAPASTTVAPVQLQAAQANPQSAAPAAMLQLQRNYGNRAVGRLVQRAQATQPRIGLKGGEVNGDLQGQINSARGGGQALDANVGAQMGQALGADFSGVRVHTGATADGLNQSLSAKAFTTGSDIFFSHGSYNPGTHSGKQLLAHELTHVVQQGGGHGNNVQTKLTVGPAGDHYEQEADRIAEQVTASPTMGAEAPVATAPVEEEATAQRIMRWVGPNSDYEIGHPVDARDAFTLNEDHVSVMPRTTGGAPGLGAGWATATPGKPPLKIADDGSMAINSQAGEPREFYALPAVLDNSNAMLETAGSPVRLARAGNTITLDGAGAAMEQVMPRKADGVLPGAGQFVSLTTTTCRDVASYIMGNGGYNFVKLGGDRVSGINTGDPTVIGGSHGIAKSMVEDQPVEHTKQKAGEGRDSEGQQVGRNYGRMLGRGELNDQSEALGVNRFAKANIGEAYTTQRIENDPTHSLRTDFSQDEHGGTTHDFTWGYHFAAVVAESGDRADQITLENYNRSGDQEEARKLLLQRLEHDFALELTDYLRDHPSPDLSIDEGTLPAEPQARDEARKIRENANDKVRRKRIGEILHWLQARVMATEQEAKTAYQQMENERLSKGTSMWYFRMVGTRHGQSFHEQMAGSNFFSNPLTMAVGGARLSGKTPISFPKAGRTVPAGSLPMVRNLARNYLTDRAMGHTKRMRITGYASGQGWGTAKRKERNRRETALARANAVKAVMVTAGVDAGLIDVTVGANDPTWTDAQKRKAVIEAV